VLGVPHQRHESLREGRIQPEAIAELGGHEGVERAHQGPAGEEIHPGPPELPGAGAGEDEAWPEAPLDQLVHYVEKLGDLLDLVDDDDLAVRVPATSSRSRSGRAAYCRCASGASRSIHSASGCLARSQVDLPVPRGPKRK
jgi:hypothetical protein